MTWKRLFLPLIFWKIYTFFVNVLINACRSRKGRFFFLNVRQTKKIYPLLFFAWKSKIKFLQGRVLNRKEKAFLGFIKKIFSEKRTIIIYSEEFYRVINADKKSIKDDPHKKSEYRKPFDDDLISFRFRLKMLSNGVDRYHFFDWRTILNANAIYCQFVDCCLFWCD